jgi:predicted alpha/beta superfamily hydrolase
MPFRLAGAFQFDMVSSQGRRYRVFLYGPSAKPPPDGFPVLYLLDGNATFATAVETAAMQMRRPEITGVPPCVIVGIGYPVDAPLDIERRRFDFTPKNAGGADQAEDGGADGFAEFVEADLKPAVEAMAPIDRRRQALFGHSFGGLFVLWSLFSHLERFQSYIAASPSIWWRERSILAHEARFIEAVRGGSPRIRLLLTVGSLERSLHPGDGTSRLRMVEDAAALAARLRSQAGDRLAVSFAELAGETHVSVIPAAISRSVRFAWSNL